MGTVTQEALGQQELFFLWVTCVLAEVSPQAQQAAPLPGPEGPRPAPASTPASPLPMRPQEQAGSLPRARLSSAFSERRSR